MSSLNDPIGLADWRRQVTKIYAHVQNAAKDDPAAAWHHFRRARDHLFCYHPQSPLVTKQKAAFHSLPYYPYEPSWRLWGQVDRDVTQETFHIDLGEDGAFSYTRIAHIHFKRSENEAQLSLFWINGYGGGLFLPFKDKTNGQETFGGGRYLYDTIKGADLGAVGKAILLDFNFAYNPSCAYNAQWVCPLSPNENYLPLAVKAGEKAFA